MRTDYFLCLGNLIFGVFAATFYMLFIFCHTSIVIPMVLNIGQFIFLLLQIFYYKWRK